MSKNKKPTMMEVKNAINNLIREFSSLTEYVKILDQTLGGYIEFKKDNDKFKSFLDKEFKKMKDKDKKEEARQ